MKGNKRLNELALFAGAGGGILGGLLCGFRTVCGVEIERFPRDVLLARQNDGTLNPFPIWDDVRTFNGKPWRGIVDVVSGGFPCQEISVARAMWGRPGLQGKRSGLWRENLRIIEEIQPKHVFGENSPALRILGLREITDGLSAIGYSSRWVTLGSDAVGLNCKRRRLWLYASRTDSEGLEGYVRDGDDTKRREDTIRPPADVTFRSCEGCGYIFPDQLGRYGCPNCNAEGAGYRVDQRQGILPRVTGMAHGVADRMDRIKAIGNGQVPAVAALAWNLLTDALAN